MAALFVSQILIDMEASQVVEVISSNCEGRMAAAAHHVMNVWAAFFQTHGLLLNARKLIEQESLFICTMESNAKKIMDGDVKSLNPLTKLWRMIDGNTMLRHGLSEYLKLAEVAIVLVLGSVEDERTFSTLSFMKDKLRNRLQTHLPMVVTMHGQTFFDINNFPYDQAYPEWKRSTRLADAV